MGSNTKIDNKTINDTKINTEKLRPGTTRIGAGGSTTIMDLEGNISFNGDIILPSKKIILDSNGNDSMIIISAEEGIQANLKIDNYNNSLYSKRDPITNSFELLGAKLLVRMYRLKIHNADGIWTGGRTQQVISESEMRKKTEQLPENMQYQDRAVVIKISQDCSDAFKNKVVPGDIVDLDPVAFNPGRMQRWLHKDNVNNAFDNYFVVPEFIVENTVHLKEIEHTLSEEDFINNETLESEGFKVGDKIII